VRICFSSTVDATPAGAAPPVLELRSVMPNPSLGSVRFTFSLPAAGVYKLEIFDASGRLVARPLDRLMPEGPNAVAWNGTDTEGRRAPSGVYFGRLSGPAGAARRQFVLLR
jgi:hypothetical protein